MTVQPPEEFTNLIFTAREPDRPGKQTIEETLLKAALSGRPELITRIAETSPGDYLFDLHRRFYATIHPYISQLKHVDRAILEETLPEPPPTEKEKVKERQALLDLAGKLEGMEIPEAGMVDSYLTILTEEAKRKEMREEFQKIQSLFDDKELTPAETHSRLFQVFMDQDTSRRLVGAFKSEAEDWPTYFADLETKQDPSHEFTGLDTGWKHFNNLANGLPEGLLVLGAVPSVGKTTWAKQIADQVIEKNPKAVCLFISLEQSREELRVKTLSRLSEVENRDILRGRLDPKSDKWKRVKTASDKYTASTAGRYFILEGDKTTTPELIRLAGMQVKRATETDSLLIVVDYLQIVRTVEDYKDSRSRVDAVVTDLRRIARELGASIVAISSIGRGSYDKPDISAFKESGGVEYGADMAALMEPRKINGEQEKGIAPIGGEIRKWEGIDLAFVKNRNGERGKIQFKFFPQISRFVELMQDDSYNPNAFDVAGKE